jgi:hypothetical protein
MSTAEVLICPTGGQAVVVVKEDLLVVPDQVLETAEMAAVVVEDQESESLVGGRFL